MPTTAYQSEYTGAEIDDAIGAVQDAAFIADDDGSGGIVVTDISLSGLTDTAISNPSNGQALVYNGTSSKWENGSVSFTETDPTVPSWAKASSKPSYTASEVGAVPTSTTVNGKALSGNISLTASDVGAVSSDGVVTIYSGSTAPSSSTGSNGDIYIQTS